MVFSSTLFLFLFLPIVLLAYFIAGRKMRNIILLVASLLFYAWGETVYVLLMLCSILVNYSFGILIDRARQQGRSGKTSLVCAVTINLLLLGFFKYANFVINNLNIMLQHLHIDPVNFQQVHLPIGISFFTFQAMSYVIDLYRGESKVQKNPVNIALYIALFPQLIAGPIVRYHDIAKQINSRKSTVEDLACGIRRFIIGLGKKVLIANVMGRTADYIFSLPPDKLPASLAWLGAVAYTLQIYFDFSGYSDMAIGLGRIFGFHFLENFNYPYLSSSIREFWRRWHISLSTWLRDYLYIPIGGSRGSKARTSFNLITVFFLCGLWHGASWTFAVWGLYHGLFLILERTEPISKLLQKLPWPVRYLYAMTIVIVGWVIFRAETLSQALAYLQAMCTPGRSPLYNSQIFLLINNEFTFTLIVGIIGAFPLLRAASEKIQAGRSTSTDEQSFDPMGGAVSATLQIAGLSFILLYSVAGIMGGSYNPFLYFRF
ncbi:MAG: MBOAT family protein [Candidatus Electrothrix sp. AR4]|nr:MBOAT family protein [Candidatus Electrothrix sp. AR4]